LKRRESKEQYARNPEKHRRRLLERYAERPGYFGAHAWLQMNYPKRGKCDRCGVEGERTEYAFLGKPGGYARDRSQYRELCCGCHRRMDAWLRRLAKFPVPA
jgi:hypothetical protein